MLTATIVGSGGTGNDDIQLLGAGLVLGRAGDDTIEVSGYSLFGDVVVNGGSGSDTLVHFSENGGAKNQLATFYGANGNDTMLMATDVYDIGD